MWNVAYPATETRSSYEVGMPRREREQQAHHGWACQPDSVPQMVYNEQVEVSTMQGYHPYWNNGPSSAWNQNQWQSSGSAYQFGPTQQQQMPYSPQQQYYPPQQQYFPQHYPSQQMQYSVQQTQFQPQHQQFQHQLPPPRKSSLEDTLNAFIQESKQARESQGVALERITTQMVQIAETVNEMMQQDSAEQLPWQSHQVHVDTSVTSDDECDEVDAHVVTTSERSVKIYDDDDEELTEPEALDEDEYLVEPIMLEDASKLCHPDLTDEAEYLVESNVVEDVDKLCLPNLMGEAEYLVESIVVHDVDKLCLPDLTDEQWKREECSLAFGFTGIAVDFFSFQDFYFIPSASFLINCSFIDATNSMLDGRFLQEDDDDCLLVGPADIRDEDELIQVMEWLKLESDFG